MSKWTERRAWLPLVFALLYGVSPIDAIPDAIPIMGVMDDLGVGGVALMLALWWWRQRHQGTATLDASEPTAP